MKLRNLFRPKEIATSLIGGLGNQMFQYAAGRALAARLGRELVLDSSPLRMPADHTPRTYALDAFKVKASLDTLTPGQLHRMLVLHENHSTNRWPDKLRAGTRLSGFWQSEGYFKDIRGDLLNEFTLSAPASPYVEGVADAIRRTPNNVSIHFRRGDYVSNAKAAEFHGTCAPHYYAAAIERIRQLIGKDLGLFVFSDDPQWVREHAGLPPGYLLVDSTLSTPAQDIWLMSLCQHHVIANSSFSWWGAWLTPEEGIVVAPQRWFQNESAPQAHIVPARWLRL